MDFLPYSSHFLGFIMQYIPDINFKISLTTIKIICKLKSTSLITLTARLLQLNGINFKKHYEPLVTSLIEKLSDSKVVIRQAVLKSCSLLISVRLNHANHNRITKQARSHIMLCNIYLMAIGTSEMALCSWLHIALYLRIRTKVVRWLNLSRRHLTLTYLCRWISISWMKYAIRS